MASAQLSSPVQYQLHPEIRRTIIAGYIISLEDAACWANKVRKPPARVLPPDLRSSPTVLGIIHRDCKKQGGLGVQYNIVDIRNQATTTRFIVLTQMVPGTWLNDWPETQGRELVRDPKLRLEEGEEDRRTLSRLVENGINAIEFGCYFF